MEIGKIFKNKDDLEFVVISKNKEKSNLKYIYYNVEFIKSGYRCCSRTESINSGSVKDKLMKSQCNIGSIGYINTRQYSHEYRIWKDMIQRCYNPKDKSYLYYGAKGITVCNRWLRFDNFVNDIPDIPNYNEYLFRRHKQRLDKDIRTKNIDNKKYSPQTTMWVSELKNQQRRAFEFNQKHIKYAIFPDGHIEQVLHVSNFCKEYNLHRQNVNLCLEGKQKATKGFKFYKE